MRNLGKTYSKNLNRLLGFIIAEEDLHHVIALIHLIRQLEFRRRDTEFGGFFDFLKYFVAFPIVHFQEDIPGNEWFTIRFMSGRERGCALIDRVDRRACPWSGRFWFLKQH